MGISLAALSGLPPSPLFVSEVLIVAGGFQAGHPWAASATALLLALGFLGLAHALIETTAGDSPPREPGPVAGLRGVTAVTCVSVVLLLALTAAAVALPDSDLADALVRGLS
jgi:formate hydrogenlyase subunit 3/multisubunit Na+/H+ antiporter MnhD subunit